MLKTSKNISGVDARRLHQGGAAHGFTLIELLVVVAVIAILIAMLVPSFFRARERARSTMCLANEKQIGSGIYYYANDNQGFSVPRMISASNSSLNWGGAPGYPLFGTVTQDAYWSDQILLGQYLANTGGDDGPVNSAFTHGTVSKRSPFICGSDKTHECADGNSGHLSYGMAPNFPSVAPPLTAGAPPPYWDMWTILSAEKPAQEIVVVDCHTERFSPGGPVDPFTFYGNDEPLVNYSWIETAPNSIYSWAKRHSGGANVLFLDGHAEFAQDLKAAYDRGEICCHRVE